MKAKLKQHLPLCLVMLCACCLLGYGAYNVSMAYLQSKDSATNRFTVGDNTSSVTNGKMGAETINANSVVSEKVEVTNTGDVPCYVRVRILPGCNVYNYTSNTDNSLTGSSNWYHVQSNIENYYYYKKVLQPGEKTSALTVSATASRDMNALNEADSDFIVYEETIQSEGHSDVLEAFK